ncbi:MAG TPA: ABC transporter permease [Acidobacteriota bacterium]|nr:ABC transporter permease [Acidobacteriota bacterium]
MKNILNIARREFIATVATKAFVIGLLIVPVMAVLMGFVLPKLFDVSAVEIEGEILVIDPTGRMASELKKTFDPVVIEARRREEARKTLAGASGSAAPSAGIFLEEGIEKALGPIPDIRVLEGSASADVDREMEWLNAHPENLPRLAVVVIHPNAVEPAGGGMEYGAYDLYVPPKLDDRVEREIRQGLREAIVNARFQARSLDREDVDAILYIPSIRSVTVTPDRQRETVRGLNFIFPIAFGLLLFLGVMGGGGQLLTTMVEEKSSRVVEVLLSAVTPMELMAGKLLGQMGAGMLGMCVYLAMGIVMLSFYALLNMLDYSLIFYLLLFFIITYLVMGSLMMAAGAAVNDMKEAQGLLAPLTILFVIPWILWMPISADPNSALSVTMSFLPPVNTFAMLLRMASSTPPPLWQVWASIAVGILSAIGAIWFAAKVFRIGLLLYGKPPNLATLIRWVRAA